MNKKKLAKSMGIGNKDSLYEKVKEMVTQGYGSIIIGRELDIDPKKALLIIRKIREENPELPISKFDPKIKKPVNVEKVEKKVKDLSSKGMTNTNISGKLNISKDIVDTISPAGKSIQEAKSTFEEVKILVETGHTVKQISEQLGITEGSAAYWASKVSSGRSRINRIDEIRTNLDEGEYETYDLAKRYNKSPFAIKGMVKRAENNFNPIKDWVRRAAACGIKFSYMKRELNVSSLDKAKSILEENFPGSFVFTTKTGEDDYLLTPVKSSKEEIEWMGEVNKVFNYSVVPEGNYMTVKFNDDLPFEEIVIWVLSDLHRGSKYERNWLIKEAVERIKNNDNHFMLSLGDLTESITKISVADAEEQYLTNSEQLIEIVRDLMPIAHKTIAYRGGNHCVGRLMKAAQFDQGQVIGSMLKVPYFNTRVLVDMEFKGVRKILSLDHKYGGAFKIGQVEDAIDRIQSYNSFTVNCFMSGHSHKAYVIPKESLELVPGKGLISSRWWIANSGSTMQRVGSYAEKSNYGPTPQDFVRYRFDIHGNDTAELVRVDCI